MTPADGSPSYTQLQVEACEPWGKFTAMDTVSSLTRLFAVLERVIGAVAAGENAQWKNGSVWVPGASKEQQTVASDNLPYAFVGRVLSTHKLPDAKVISESWMHPQRTGVRLLRPASVQIEPVILSEEGHHEKEY